jgi:hypothetical protein
LKTDYSPSDDFGFTLGLLVLPLVWGKQKLRSYRARNWPVCDAKIETGEVMWGTHTATSSIGEYAVAKLGYSYVVDGLYHSGYHTEWFSFAQDAWDYVGAWKGTTIRVRHHLRKPEISVWREQEQV